MSISERSKELDIQGEPREVQGEAKGGKRTKRGARIFGDPSTKSGGDDAGKKSGPVNEPGGEGKKTVQRAG